MKEFCDCNESWIYGLTICVDRQVVVVGRGFVYCSICTMLPWYNADHENMLFDLRGMNQ